MKMGKNQYMVAPVLDQALTGDCLNWRRGRESQAWVRKFWVVGKRRKSKRADAANLFKPPVYRSYQTFSSPLSRDLIKSFQGSPSIDLITAIHGWDICLRLLWADLYVGCGWGHCQQQQLKIASKRKSDFAMARKSASPFYGLNNMLAVEEEEDEGGWGVVSSFSYKPEI